MRERIFWLVVTFHTTAAGHGHGGSVQGAEPSRPSDSHAPGAYRGLRHGVAGAAGNGEIARALAAARQLDCAEWRTLLL